MRQLNFWLRFITAFFSRFRIVFLVGLFIGIALFLISRFIAPRFLTRTTTIGLTGRFAPDNLPLEILEDIGDGLTKLSADSVVEPNLAVNWETPDKGKTWIFYLKNGVVWQDGQKLESQDINYQFSDVTVEKPDEKTIVFKLTDPFSPFPSVVSKPFFKTGFLGTGEWKVTNISLTGSFVQRITLEKRGEGKKVYKFFPTEERTKLAFKMGQVDVITDIINPAPLNSWETAEILRNIKRNEIVTLFYNNEDDLFKDNKDLRQALNYAINKDNFEGERAISSIPPNNWVYNPQVKPYVYNRDRAQELLENTKVTSEIKLVTSPVLLDVAESISKDWEQVGVKTLIQVSSVVPTDFQVYLTILAVPSDPDQYSIWHSTQKDSTNIAKFGNHRIDKLLEDGRTELDVEDRRKLYLDFQRFIVEEMPAAFLYHPVTYTIRRK